MATLPIDCSRLVMISTGKVAPMQDWQDGKATGMQARDKDSGLPLWTVDVLLDDDDATRSSMAGVVIAAPVQPVVSKFRPVPFEGLTVSYYYAKSRGQLVERWTATGIAGADAKAA